MSVLTLMLILAANRRSIAAGANCTLPGASGQFRAIDPAGPNK
ncbi:hypothetical protein QUA20_09790 [Microcoleus sp. Pol7_A1]